MPIALNLPEPCRVCRGPIPYSGKGRRPTVCSPACRRAARADDAATRRAEAQPPQDDRPTPAHILELLDDMAAQRARYDDDLPPLTRSARGALSQEPHAETLASLSDYALEEDAEPELVVVEVTRNGTRWDNGKATSRSRDAAARWLAEHHPDELATFPVAV